jgi:hypothetical protein
MQTGFQRTSSATNAASLDCQAVAVDMPQFYNEALTNPAAKSGAHAGAEENHSRSANAITPPGRIDLRVPPNIPALFRSH